MVWLLGIVLFKQQAFLFIHSVHTRHISYSVTCAWMFGWSLCLVRNAAVNVGRQASLWDLKSVHLQILGRSTSYVADFLNLMKT